MQKVAACLASLMLFTAAALADQQNLRLPEPPKQHSAWHPDAAIPTNILSAAEKLFEQGFPDPRGCEYREIEVAVSGIWEATNIVVKTRGWVLPGKSRDTNRFAICWNGLIYPVIKVSEPADLHAETANAAPNRGFDYSAAGEIVTVLFVKAQTSRGLLLLRCGETETALKCLADRPRAPDILDPYLDFSGDWAWAMFDRTICAHMRGDEALALVTARQLAVVQPQIEAECAKRGFPRQHSHEWGQQEQDKPYLDFLGQLPQLLADLERRGKEGRHMSVIESGLQKIPDASGRVTALVHDLDLVRAHQWGQPGGVNLADDAIVSALIEQGDAAIDPLIDCLENDQHLTRSVGFHRDFFRQRSVVPVHNAASTAVQAILHAGFQNVAALKQYWIKYKGLTIDERCYAILKDDSAVARWPEAVSYITQPENEMSYASGWVTIRTAKSAPTNAPVRMRGEVLRSKSDPSVSELMARRALEIPAGNPGSYNLSAGCDMGLQLAKWDLRAAGPVAATLARRCSEVMKYSNERLGTKLARLTVVRAEAGEPRPFDDYAAWLKNTNPEDLEHALMECLEPLQRFPTNQVLEDAAEGLFEDSSSRWWNYPWPNTAMQNPIESDLIKVRPFRHWLASKLGNEAVCGTIEYHAPGNFSYQITNYVSGGFTVAVPENEQLTNGASAVLRWCDWIAFSLSKTKQIPFFDPTAPIDKRDEAIKSARAMLGK